MITTDKEKEVDLNLGGYTGGHGKGKRKQTEGEMV